MAVFKKERMSKSIQFREWWTPLLHVPAVIKYCNHALSFLFMTHKSLASNSLAFWAWSTEIQLLSDESSPQWVKTVWNRRINSICTWKPLSHELRTEWASEWKNERGNAQTTRAVRSKRLSERCKWTSEWRSEWPTRRFHSHSFHRAVCRFVAVSSRLPTSRMERCQIFSNLLTIYEPIDFSSKAKKRMMTP